jgi:hypothetical protein
MEEAMRMSLLGLLLVIVVAAAGCGANPKKQRQEFLAKANAICGHFEDKQNQVLFPSVNPLAADISHADRAEWGLSLNQVVDLGLEEVKSLRKLKPPGDLRGRFQEMVDTKEAAFNDLAKSANAAKRNRRTLIKAPTQAARAKLTRVSVLAKQIGMRHCA